MNLRDIGNKKTDNKKISSLCPTEYFFLLFHFFCFLTKKPYLKKDAVSELTAVFTKCMLNRFIRIGICYVIIQVINTENGSN